MDGRITHGVSSNDARNNWGEVLGAAHNAPVTITSYGRNVAVLMDPQLAKRALEALEAVEDLAAADAALADTSDAVAWQGGGGVGAGIPFVRRLGSLWSWCRWRAPSLRPWTAPRVPWSNWC
ncbi:prevent-host-death family protein [Arthrobacter silviterrae]|uniref:Antitoxin n=1 Tax=Arthrobacter silviterrae TaxID=2026658 RepID=A0ABX0D9S1_9MICC|nr:type II toxin-antitoxin system Phd/YefM family antitoxin [Arthrobacter silviterrae]MDQ0279361.1 prevent-host-death family protein [Arthrobacter silviterrae]NGN83438.1 type II toxin-antitoxin system Phd/YefM family antitoxin [Arthrobacter silviterrae]